MHKYLITAALLLVFGTSAYMSISGLTAVFAGGGLLVVCMGAGMELGKLLSVVHLHRSWRGLRILPRLFFITVIAALTLITTVEILGYLTQRHGLAVRDLAAVETAMAALGDEEAVLRAEMRVLDETLAGLPPAYVTRRLKEREKAGYGRMQARLRQIAAERADLSARRVDEQAGAGPVIAVARIMGLDPAHTISTFIIFLVCVLEPLAIGLAVAASAAWAAFGKPERPGRKVLPAAGETAGRTAETAGMSFWPTYAADPAAGTAKAAEMMAETAETAKAAKAAAVRRPAAADEPAKAADSATGELVEICRRHGLTIEDLAGITGRKQPQTVAGWLAGTPPIPIKALRLVRKWAAGRPPMRLVAAE